jgi:hypothetical protein
MASATGIPETYSNVSVNEQEPLLGRVGDVSQERGMPLYNNLNMGRLTRTFPGCLVNAY